MSNIKRYICIYLGISFFLFAQAQSEDFGTRVSLGLSSELRKNLTCGFELEQRFKDNSTRLDRSLAQLSLEYEMFKNLELSTGYRIASLAVYNSNNILKHRFYTDLSYSIKLLRFKPSYRIRWQQGGDQDFLHTTANKILRQRFKITYDWFGLPLTPYASYELFKALKTQDQGAFQAYRTECGAELKINKSLSIDISWLRDNEINVSNPETLNCLCFAVEYDF